MFYSEGISHRSMVPPRPAPPCSVSTILQRQKVQKLMESAEIQEVKISCKVPEAQLNIFHR